MWRASSAPASVPVIQEPMAATTWSMVVGRSSSTFALYHALTPPCMPVRMTCGNGSTEACFMPGVSGTMRMWARWTRSLMTSLLGLQPFQSLHQPPQYGMHLGDLAIGPHIDLVVTLGPCIRVR